MSFSYVEGQDWANQGMSKGQPTLLYHSQVANCSYMTTFSFCAVPSSHAIQDLIEAST